MRMEHLMTSIDKLTSHRPNSALSNSTRWQRERRGSTSPTSTCRSTWRWPECPRRFRWRYGHATGGHLQAGDLSPMLAGAAHLPDRERPTYKFRPDEPMTYNSLIGDMGSSRSGGQQQRVLLDR